MQHPLTLCAFAGSYNPELLLIGHLGSSPEGIFCRVNFLNPWASPSPVMAQQGCTYQFRSLQSFFTLNILGLSVTQTGVQWRDHYLLQPPLPGLNRSSYLSLPKTGFCHVAQADLKHLNSSDSSISASQSAGISGTVAHACNPSTLEGQGRQITRSLGRKDPEESSYLLCFNYSVPVRPPVVGPQPTEAGTQ
ncbi:Histone demethylase UTY [Plecturocebus cupreus]